MCKPKSASNLNKKAEFFLVRLKSESRCLYYNFCALPSPGAFMPRATSRTTRSNATSLIDSRRTHSNKQLRARAQGQPPPTWGATLRAQPAAVRRTAGWTAARRLARAWRSSCPPSQVGKKKRVRRAAVCVQGGARAISLQKPLNLLSLPPARAPECKRHSKQELATACTRAATLSAMS